MSKNLHHTLWVKRQYHRIGREPLALREHPVMKHRMEVGQHNDLHAHIYPLPVISRGLAISALAFIPSLSRDNRLDSFSAVIEHFGNISKGLGRQAIESGDFAEHLEEQMRYINGTI